MLLHASKKKKKRQCNQQTVNSHVINGQKHCVTFDDVFACNSILFVIYLLYVLFEMKDL